MCCTSPVGGNICTSYWRFAEKSYPCTAIHTAVDHNVRFDRSAHTHRTTSCIFVQCRFFPQLQNTTICDVTPRCAHTGIRKRVLTPQTSRQNHYNCPHSYTTPNTYPATGSSKTRQSTWPSRSYSCTWLPSTISPAMIRLLNKLVTSF